MKRIFPKPDIAFFLDISLEEARKREKNKKDVKEFEKRILLNESIFKTYRLNLLESLYKFADDIIILDTNAEIDYVQKYVRSVVNDRSSSKRYCSR